MHTSNLSPHGGAFTLCFTQAVPRSDNSVFWASLQPPYVSKQSLESGTLLYEHRECMYVNACSLNSIDRYSAIFWSAACIHACM